jgi:hypothetical protein
MKNLIQYLLLLTEFKKLYLLNIYPYILYIWLNITEELRQELVVLMLLYLLNLDNFNLLLFLLIYIIC